MKGVIAIQKYFWEKRCAAFNNGRKLTRQCYNDPMYVVGFMLYWGEGSKSGGGAEIANSDDRVIRFMVAWFERFFGYRPESIRIHMHLHSGQNEESMEEYWSQITGIPLQNFQKSFVKPEGSGYRKKIFHQRSTYALYTILGCIAEYVEMAIGYKSQTEDWTQKLPYAHVRP